jgi:hypothetical protein
VNLKVINHNNEIDTTSKLLIKITPVCVPMYTMVVMDPEVHCYLVHLSQYFICWMNIPKKYGVVLTEETVQVYAKKTSGR